ERLVHAPHAAIGDHASHLVAATQQLADTAVLVVGEHRNLCGAGQLRAVDRAKARVVGVQAPTQRTRLHASLASLAPAGATARKYMIRLQLGHWPSSSPRLSC